MDKKHAFRLEGRKEVITFATQKNDRSHLPGPLFPRTIPPPTLLRTMRRIITTRSDITARLGTQTAAAIRRLEEDTLRRHPHCFAHYRALDMLNAALCLADLLHDEWGLCEAREWIDDLHRRPTCRDADAWHRGELVVKLGGLDEEDTLTRLLWQLTATLTGNDTLPPWADEMMADEMPHNPPTHPADTPSAPHTNPPHAQPQPHRHADTGPEPRRPSRRETMPPRHPATVTNIYVQPGAIFYDLHENQNVNAHTYGK